jgi:triosephosphate isomerase (TIM)
MRKKVVAGNWKMNKTLEEGLALTSEIVNMAKDEVRNDVTIILNPPFPLLNGVYKLVKDTKQIFLGAQNCSEHASGAYTGEVSVSMIKSVGAEYVILGHSERREYFKESNELLATKVNIALENNLKPIFCCGESLEIRENGTYVEFVRNQITQSLFHLTAEQTGKIIIAYEPIWAIGTGKTATSDQAQEMHLQIRQHVASKYGKELADDMTILYGGSCNPKNARDLFSNPDVDGGLIGGASLKSRDFIDIINSF